MLAHIGGVPVEESLLYVAPVIAIVGWMYYAGWRERREHGAAPETDEGDAQSTQAGRDTRAEGARAARSAGKARPAPDAPSARARRASGR